MTASAAALASLALSFSASSRSRRWRCSFFCRLGRAFASANNLATEALDNLSDDSAAIQEVHQFLMHACCEMLEPDAETR